MKLTIQMQVLPAAQQKAILLETMERFNEGASFAAKAAFEAGVFSQPSIHKLVYREIRERFELSAQMAVRAIGKVVECFKRDKTKCPVFKPLGAVTYDQRILGFKGLDKVSLWALGGRMILPLIYGEYQGERFDRIKGQCDLVFRKGRFYLYATVEIPEKAPIEVTDFLGVDPGIVNIATDSDGKHHTKSEVEAKRVQYAKRRKVLGKATKDADRRKRRGCHKAAAQSRRKESRFRKDVNHQISKRLVEKAKDTGRGIAYEDDSGIHERTTVQKHQRARHRAWAFDQLGNFIEYKAALQGVEFLRAPSAYSSQRCNVCGHTERSNRATQAVFRCKVCGHEAHADINSAQNHRDWARVACQATHGRGKGRARDARLMPSTATSRLL
jgi:putative transposase